MLHYARSIHFDMHTFHSSPAQILRKIQQDFWVLREGTVRDAVEGCYLCQTSTPSMETRQRYALQQLPDRPRTHLAFDICGGVREDKSGYRYVYVCVDLFTNYVLGAAAKTRTSQEIQEFFRLTVLNYAIIQKLRIDGEIALLRNKEFNDFLTTYGIQRQRSSRNCGKTNVEYKEKHTDILSLPWNMVKIFALPCNKHQ